MLPLDAKHHSHSWSVGCSIDKVLRIASGYRRGNIEDVAARQHAPPYDLLALAVYKAFMPAGKRAQMGEIIRRVESRRLRRSTLEEKDPLGKLCWNRHKNSAD